MALQDCIKALRHYLQGHTPPDPHHRATSTKTAQYQSLQLGPTIKSDLLKAQLSTLAHVTPRLLVVNPHLVPCAYSLASSLSPDLECEAVLRPFFFFLFCWVVGSPTPKRHRPTQEWGRLSGLSGDFGRQSPGGSSRL